MKVGNNTIISSHARIRKPSLCEIGHDSIIDDFCYISCALKLGNYSHIGANCTIIGGSGVVTIGDFVNIAPGCRIICASHDYIEGGLCGPCIPKEYQGESIVSDVVISDHVLLGCNTVVLPGAYLPEGMATGAMTLVGIQEYEAWTLYVGIPAYWRNKRLATSIQETAERMIRELNNR